MRGFPRSFRGIPGSRKEAGQIRLFGTRVAGELKHGGQVRSLLPDGSHHRGAECPVFHVEDQRGEGGVLFSQGAPNGWPHPCPGSARGKRPAGRTGRKVPGPSAFRIICFRFHPPAGC